MKKLTSETGILTKAFNGMHALVKRLKPAIDRMMQTLQIGAKKGMGMVKNVIDKLGGVDNALKLLAIIAGAFFYCNELEQNHIWSKGIYYITYKNERLIQLGKFEDFGYCGGGSAVGADC